MTLIIPPQLTHFTYPQHGTAISSIGWAAVAQFREQQGQSETTLMKPQKFGDHWKCAWTLMLIKWWTISEYNLFHPHTLLLLLAHNHHHPRHHRRCVSISAIISGREIERTMTGTDKTTGAATNWIQGKWSSTCSVCHWPKRWWTRRTCWNYDSKCSNIFPWPKNWWLQGFWPKTPASHKTPPPPPIDRGLGVASAALRWAVVKRKQSRTFW